MEGRFLGAPHLKNGGELEQAEGRCTTIARLFNPSTYQADGFSALSQKCLKRNYDEMVAASYGGVGGVGPGMLSEGCFPRPGIPPSPVSHPPPPHLQQMLYRQPYSIPHGSGSLTSDEMHHLVQEPKFPPQTFEIPDIQDSNSVFCDGSFDGAPYGAYPPAVAASLAQGIDRQAFFYGSPDHSQCRTVGLAFPGGGGGWQQQQQQGVVSSAGSTNSSPASQVEDVTPVAEAGGGSVQTQQQVQQQLQQGGLKMNGFSTSHSAVSRLPNKKARSPKRRKRKDPNEPQKPVSAYSLFFRNAQAAIKSQNPSATFGDVSKIVASMWDSLDDDVKNFYKRQMEVAKKEYLKQLAIYRATLVSKQDVQGKTSSEVEAGLGAPHSAPSSSPSAPPVPSKTEDGSMAGLGLSPVTTSICMSSSGYPGQVPMSPAPETMTHMMSPPTNHLQTSSPRYYSDGPPRLPPGSYSTSSDVNTMRNTFLPYSQKLDHESLLSGMSEHGGYFLSSIPDPGYKSSREYISLENNFVNGPSRDMPGRPFIDSDDGPTLT